MNINKIIQKLSQGLWVVCLFALFPLSVNADETEIFYQQDASKVNTNVLFVLDASGSMDAVLTDDAGGRTRMQVMKDAFREVMEEAPANLNVGLMNYGNAEFLYSYQWDSVGGVDFPISAIDSEASPVIGSHAATDNLPDPQPGLPVRAFLSDVVDSWDHAGYTPIVDSLYEATRYFRGENSVWGKYPPAYLWAAHPSTYTGDLVCESPKDEECRLEWGECNGTQKSCVSKPISSCCDWVEGSDGGYCTNNDYSCSVDISHCQHTLCEGGVSGTATYNKPIEYSCQVNYMVLMSDGKPEYPFYTSRTEDGTGQYAKSSYPDRVYDTYLVPTLAPTVDSSVISTDIPALIGSSCADKPEGYASGTCGPELVNFLATQDQNDELEGEQIIETYTVAFALADEPKGAAYLASLATVENGAYTADNAEELAEAFKNVFGEIEKQSLSFSSPSFSVSEDSLLANGNDVFVPVFDSKSTPLWPGNLRKFSLSDDNSIVGADGSEALTSSGNFTETAQDLWSTTPHGADVGIGGAAGRLPPPANRTLKTDAAGNSLVDISSATESSLIPAAMFTDGTRRTRHGLIDFLDGEAGGDGISTWGWYIDCAGNRITVGAGRDIPGPVNIADVTTCEETISTAQRDTLLNFARGYEAGVSNPAVARNHMGDILNTKPLVVKYGSKSLVLVATNEGYLHAIDADTGVEEWAFMPFSLLKNQKLFFEDSEDKRHVYGLDGALTLWNYDADNDGAINTDAGSNDKRYLFFGMRRGGNMYYALDISNPTVPTIAWKISPDTLSGAESQGYSDLGETWSKPTLSRMRVKKAGSSTGELKYVLVFGGGYDPRMDEQDISQRGSDQYLGADVFIADALTGERLWSLKANGETRGSVSSVSDSIPGDIRVLDMDNNGELDRLYFGDTGGNIWRVDIRPTTSAEGEFDISPRLTHFADLGGPASTIDDGDRRKFFYEPDTALRLDHGKPVLTIAIGSGYRTHPLDLGDNDRFYVLLDENVYNEPPTDTATTTEPAVITESDLVESTSTGLADSILTVNDKKGWYLDLAHKGEKVLATSLTFLDKVIFTTFAQADENNLGTTVGPCEPLVSTSRAYVLDLLTGRPVANLDRDVDTDENGVETVSNDGFVIAGHGQILDAPQLVFSQLTDGNSGDCVLGQCQQSVSIRVGKLDVPVLDLDNSLNSSDASYSETVDLTKILPRLYWRDGDVSGTGTLVGEAQE